MVKRNLPKYVYRKSGKYLYFCKGSLAERMPDDPASTEFAVQYAKLISGRGFKPAKRNVSMLIERYMSTDKFKDHARNTRISYQKAFQYFEEKIGQYDPASFKPHHIVDMQYALKDTPTTANRRVAVLSVLFKYAIKIGWMDTNPAFAIEALKTKRPPRQPWPREMVDSFRAEAPARPLLLFELLLGTGQRIGDVLAMQWAHMEDGGIWVRQSKTDRKLFVPLTERLATILDAIPRQSLYIVSQGDGRPVSYQLAWKEIKEVRDAIGAQAWDIHSLRHSAASEIAAIPGMTEEHVKAITGHTSGAMVSLYAGAAAQKARAKEAQKKRK